MLEKDDDDNNCANKKLKLCYKLEKEAAKLITADTMNKKYWDDCKELLEKGKKVCNLYFKCI